MGIVGAFVIALLVALLFSPYKDKDSVKPLIVLFLVLFFAGFAAQYWIIPFGPIMWGVSWLPTLFIVLIFALLFSAPPPHKKQVAVADIVVQPAITIMSVFIWIILLLLVTAILVGIYYRFLVNNLEVAKV